MENVKADKINIEKRLQCLETKVEWLEMEKSTEKSVKQGPTRENTCKGKISDEIDKDPCVMQENIKIVCENEKMPVGRSSELENNTSDEGNERHLNGRLEEIRLAERAKDVMEWKYNNGMTVSFHTALKAESTEIGRLMNYQAIL